MNKLAKIACSAGLALALTFAATPTAGASSYASFLRQYVLQQQQQQTQPSVPTPAPPVVQPQPQQPVQQQQQVNNFWTSRAQGRAALLQNTNTSPTAPAPAPTPAPAPAPAPAPSQLTAREQHMLNLINKERTDRGLRPLQADMRLTRLARLKSQDIVDNNYFAHQSPTYGSSFDMMRSANISFLRAGENLSKAGGVDVSHLRLMNSTNHRANILNPYYTHIGIGIVNNNPSGVVVTQMFIQAP